MTRTEAETILREHDRFLRAEGEYYFTSIPPYTIQEVKQAKQLLLCPPYQQYDTE